ncbi:MAG TPA: hypothetical protein VJQ08_02870 [Candidatus Dormibacteraeota bacterium]|nr:hypothetical protein [Candidatus Dormibacteraeota bacterium]
MVISTARAAACLAASLALMAACSPGSSSSTPTPVVKNQSPSPSAVPSASATAAPTLAPTPPPTPFLYLLILQSEYGSLSAQTEAGASCSATAQLPNGQAAGGVRNPQTADASGMVYWTYPQPSTAEGTGTHTVRCSRDGLSASNWAYFQIGA